MIYIYMGPFEMTWSWLSLLPYGTLRLLYHYIPFLIKLLKLASRIPPPPPPPDKSMNEKLFFKISEYYKVRHRESSKLTL